MIDDTFLICPQCLEVLNYKNFIHSGSHETVVKNRKGLCNVCTSINQIKSSIKSRDVQQKKRLLKLDEDIKNGVKKLCLNCKRYFRVKFINSNGFCKCCIGFSIKAQSESNYELTLSLNVVERKEIVLKDFNTPLFEKEKKQLDLDKKIFEFYLQKEKNEK